MARTNTRSLWLNVVLKRKTWTYVVLNFVFILYTYTMYNMNITLYLKPYFQRATSKRNISIIIYINILLSLNPLRWTYSVSLCLSSYDACPSNCCKIRWGIFRHIIIKQKIAQNVDTRHNLTIRLNTQIYNTAMIIL